MMFIAQSVVAMFGFFIIAVGVLMLFYPKKALATLQKAGSTNLINYGEITIRMIPAIALVIYSPQSRFPEILQLFGWFMLATSAVLYVVPRRIHHAYSMKWVKLLKPWHVRSIAPFSFVFGGAILYSIT
jgi:hypothetical protein